MSWIVCPSCALKHSAREDGRCPRCSAAVLPGAAAPRGSSGPPEPAPSPAPGAPTPGGGAASPAASPGHEDLKEASREFWGALVATGVGIGLTSYTWTELEDLEAGKIALVRVWAPVAWAYRSFGKTGALAVMVLVTTVALAATIFWRLKARALRPAAARRLVR